LSSIERVFKIRENVLGAFSGHPKTSVFGVAEKECIS